MAEGRMYACSGCAFTVEAWSDGNPYYRDERGRKRYAYHPDHENLARCIGNDAPHLCMGCGAIVKVDSAKPTDRCRKCKAGPLVPVWEIGGLRCPRCGAGVFVNDPTRQMLS